MADFDKDQFRLDFPEFADTTKYTDAMLTFWAGVGDLLLNVIRWADLRPTGMALFVAHNIILQAQHVENAAAGGVPGTGNGLIASESAGPLSVSVDNNATVEEKGGNYNLTVYGTQFIRLSNIVGMGGAIII